MKVKKSLQAIALTALIFSGSTTVHAGIPTIDATAIKNQIETWKIEAERWTQTLNEYKKAYQAQLDQIATQTGARDIVGFINESKKQYDQVKDLTKWIQNPDMLLTYGKDALNSELRAIYDRYGMTSICDGQTDESQKKLCEGKIIITATKEQQNRRDLERVNNRVDEINKIADRMAKATDTKEAQDLSNAMQTQIALLQADKIQMDIAQNVQQQQENLLEQKAWDELAKANLEDTKDLPSLFGK